MVSNGTVLNLPVNIPEPVLSLDGRAPPRLRSISCYNASGFYTIGNDLHIYLEYYASVMVQGTPAIVLNTGCRSSSCVTSEIQTFTCRATRGMFSMKIGDEVIMNIAVNTTAQRLAYYLRELVHIQNVSVTIAPGDDNVYNQNRVCSDVGNAVTITFFEVDYPGTNGDVPTIFLNRYNDNPHPLTKLSQVQLSFSILGMFCIFTLSAFDRAKTAVS